MGKRGRSCERERERERERGELWVARLARGEKERSCRGRDLCRRVRKGKRGAVWVG
jgi:hypothetical protein